MTARDSYLRRKYGITEAEWDAAFARQDGRCAICRKRSPSRRLAVDHDHETGEWRGFLICKRCNEGIGRFEFSTDVVENAIRYLQAIVNQRLNKYERDSKNV